MTGRSYLENRGDDEYPFGYVYYESTHEDSRLGYARCEDGHVHVFVSNWGQPTRVGTQAMTRTLLKHFGKDASITTAPLSHEKDEVS